MNNLKVESLSPDRLIGDAMPKINFNGLFNLQSADGQNNINPDYVKGGSDAH